MIPAPSCPLACRCDICVKRNPAGYVHNGSVAEMVRHLAGIVATERLQGIRPLERMPEHE